MIYLYLFLVFFAGYILGNINFARIFSWAFAKKDITTVGSKNPGTMNMLRTRGFGEAFLTLIFEAIKAGLPALVFYFVFKEYLTGYENVAYFLTAFGAIVGHCFPVFYKFKGGKGVACTFGMFVFHPQFWWISLIMFVICFFLFFFIDYPFIISMLFILTMTICATVMYALEFNAYLIAVLVILWLNFLLILFMHRGNIKRLLTGKENKVHFKDKIFKKHKKDSVEENNSADVTEPDESKAEPTEKLAETAEKTSEKTDDKTTTD